MSPVKSESKCEIEVTGCGAAIERCKQVVRYIKQQLRSKYQNFIREFQSTEAITADVTVVDYLNDSGTHDEENAFDLVPNERVLNRVVIKIIVVF